MSLKALIFFGLLAVALGFTLPEEQVDSAPSEWVNPEVIPISDDVFLVRRARSPQGRLDGRFTHSDSHGSRATLDYTHPINKNWEFYAQGERNFRFRDTRAESGLRFKF